MKRSTDLSCQIQFCRSRSRAMFDFMVPMLHLCHGAVESKSLPDDVMFLVASPSLRVICSPRRLVNGNPLGGLQPNCNGLRHDTAERQLSVRAGECVRRDVRCCGGDRDIIIRSRCLPIGWSKDPKNPPPPAPTRTQAVADSASIRP